MDLITGGTGFIGVHLAKRLIARGRDVTLVDLRPDLDLLRLVVGERPGRVEIVKADIAVPTEVMGVVAKVRPAVVFHLASLLPPDAERDAMAALANITGGHVAVLEAARLFGVERVVWAGATSVFGPPECHGGPAAVVGDDAPHHPKTLYGITKSANERLSALYRDRHGVLSLGFRFCQGYGPGKQRGRPFGYRVFEDLLAGRPTTLPYGDDVINWQSVDDIAEILARAAEMRPTGRLVYNTTGEVLSTRDSAALLADLVPGARIALEPGTAGLVWRYDAGALARDLGFAAPTPARAGFAATLATMRAWRAAEAAP